MNLYSVDLKICATAYIKANSKAEALAKAKGLHGDSPAIAKLVTVEAENSEQALQLASDKVKRMRGVIRIDGGEWRA